MTTSTTVRKLAAFMNSNLPIDSQIYSPCETAWMNLYKTNKICLFLTSDQLKTIIHAHMTSKLDFNNGLRTVKVLEQAPTIQNAAAILISGSKEH